MDKRALNFKPIVFFFLFLSFHGASLVEYTKNETIFKKKKKIQVPGSISQQPNGA